MKKVLAAAAAFLAVLLLAAAALYVDATRVAEVNLPGVPGPNARGTLYKVERIGHYSAAAVRILLWYADLPEEMSIRNGTTLYRVQYWTTRYDGTPTVASGLLALPSKGPFYGVVSYQHGTNPNRHNTPSQPTLGEGILGAAIFNGADYLFVAPDYVGLGANHEIHPYLHAEETTKAVIDLLQAAKSFTRMMQAQWPNKLYLFGFSQGGHATLATQRALEARNDADFEVVASALASSPYGLRDITFPKALEGSSAAHCLYLGYLVHAYCTIYGQPPDSMLRPPYAERVGQLFDGEHEVDDILSALPRKPRDLLAPAFLEKYDAGARTWFLDALEENQVPGWKSRAPVRVYFGEGDQDVSPDDARAAYDAFRNEGADVALVSVGDCGHDESAYRAVPKIRTWFDEVSGRMTP